MPRQRSLTPADIEKFLTAEQIVGLIQQEVPKLMTQALEKYDKSQEAYRAEYRRRWEETCDHLREIYGNGSGKLGYLERARAEDKAVQAEWTRRQDEISDQVAHIAKSLLVKKTEEQYLAGLIKRMSGWVYSIAGGIAAIILRIILRHFGVQVP